MSKEPETDPELARMRRLGGRVWLVTFAVDGYDQLFTFAVRGDLQQMFAENIARAQCMEAAEVRGDHVYLNNIEKERG